MAQKHTAPRTPLLVLSGLHWKASTPNYELWWHCLRVISSLMHPAKWVQSIKSKGDGCLSALFPSLLADKSSSSSSIYARWYSKLVLSPSKDIRVSSGSSGIIISLGLWCVIYTFHEGMLLVPFKVCFFDIGSLSFDPILGFLSSHKLN